MSRSKGIIARRDGRNVFSNLGWLFAGRGVRLIFSFLVGAWVARYLGPAAYGELSYVLALIGIISILPALGLESIVRKDLVQTPEAAERLLSSTAKTRMIIAATVYAGLLVYTFWGERNADEQKLLLILGPTLFQPVLMTPDLWFQAKMLSKFTTWAQGGALVVAAALRIGLILMHASLWAFAAAIVFEMAVTGGLLAVFARRQAVHWLRARLDISLVKSLLRESWPLIASSVAILIYTRIDQVMLRSMADEAAVGVYSAAVRVSEMVYFVPVALVSGLLPLWVQARERGAKEFRRTTQAIYDIQAALAYALAIPLAFAASWVIRLLYGAAFHGSAVVLALHVWAVLFVFLGVTRSQHFVLERLNQYTLWTTIAGAVCNVVLNWLWIPHYGALGAAAATVVSQAVATWLSSFCLTAARPAAWMQFKALLIPFLWVRYVRSNQ